MKRSNLKRKKAVVVAGLVFIGAATLGALMMRAQSDVPEQLRGVAVEPVALESVRLTRHDGQVMHESSFQDHWTFVFFGFTHCPDICPSTLMQLVQVKKALGPASGNRAYRFLFVSVDPARDTPARIQEYVKYFDPEFIGATAAPGDIEHFEGIFGAAHRIEKATQPGAHYNVVHSSEIYIVDPRARWVGKWQPPLDPARVETQLMALGRYIEQQGGEV